MTVTSSWSGLGRSGQTRNVGNNVVGSQGRTSVFPKRTSDRARGPRIERKGCHAKTRTKNVGKKTFDETARPG